MRNKAKNLSKFVAILYTSFTVVACAGAKGNLEEGSHEFSDQSSCEVAPEHNDQCLPDEEAWICMEAEFEDVTTETICLEK